VFGVGRATTPAEAEAVRAPLARSGANRELSREGRSNLQKAFNQRRSRTRQAQHDPPARSYAATSRGDHLGCRAKTLPSSAGQQVVSASREALDFLAKHDIRGIIGRRRGAGGANEKVVQPFREARARSRQGGRAGEGLCMGSRPPSRKASTRRE